MFIHLNNTHIMAKKKKRGFKSHMKSLSNSSSEPSGFAIPPELLGNFDDDFDDSLEMSSIEFDYSISATVNTGQSIEKFGSMNMTLPRTDFEDRLYTEIFSSVFGYFFDFEVEKSGYFGISSIDSFSIKNLKFL